MDFFYGFIAGILTIILPSLVAMAFWFRDAPVERRSSHVGRGNGERPSEDSSGSLG